MKKILPLFILLAASSATVVAQKVYHHQNVYWMRYQNQLILSPNVYWTNEFDNRRYFSPNLQSQYIMHSRLHRKLDRFDFAAGLTYSVAHTNRPEAGYRTPRQEIRPVAEISHEFQWGKVFIQNRLRIDNRFLGEPGISVFDNSDFVVRFRYRFQVRIPLVKNETGTTVFGARIYDEIMVNTEKNFYDQNRVYIIFDYLLHKNLTIEGGYIYIDQHAFGREEYFSRHVARLSLNHRVNWKK